MNSCQSVVTSVGRNFEITFQCVLLWRSRLGNAISLMKCFIPTEQREAVARDQFDKIDQSRSYYLSDTKSSGTVVRSNQFLWRVEG